MQHIPTIGAMMDIERRTGLTIHKLLSMAQAEGWPPTLAERIGCTYAFLLQGIGYETDTPVMLTPEIIASIRQPDWRDMFMTYVGVMGRPVAEFRQITMAEYALVVEGFCLHHQLEGASVSAPATAMDLAEMIKRFPDEAENEP